MKCPESTELTLQQLLDHAGLVCGLARALVGDVHHAEDVAQDTWLAALERPPARSPRAWLASVVRRRAARIHRGQARRERRHGAAPIPPPTRSTAEGAERAEQVRLLGQALAALPPPQRDVLLQRYYEGLAPRQIAKRLGIPVNTVRSRTRRGIEQMRTFMDDHANGDRKKWLAALIPLARAPVGGLTGVLVLGAALFALVAIGTTVFLALRDAPDAPSPQRAAERGATAMDAQAAPPELHGRSQGKETQAVGATVAGANPPNVPAPAAPPAPPLIAGFGVVTDPDGVGIRGAQVSIRPGKDHMKLLTSAGQTPGTDSTDAGGRFALWSSPLLRGGFVVVEADGYTAHRTEFRPGARIDVQLDRGMVLDVRVVDATGKPMAQIDVGFTRNNWHRTVSTDGAGRARFPYMSFGRYRLRASSEHHVGQSGPVELRPGADAMARIVVRPRAILRGAVLHAESGEGVSDATVSLHEGRPNAPRLTMAKTDQEGRFALPLDIANHGMLRAAAPGLGEAWSMFQHQRRLTGLPLPDAVEPLIIRLGAGVRSEMRVIHVIDAAGDLQANTIVEPLLSAEVRTSARPGVFSFLAAPGTTMAGFRATHADGRLGIRSCNPLRLEGPLLITLADAGSLSGIVIDPTGRPAAGALVELSMPDPLLLPPTRPEHQVHNALRLVPEKMGVHRVTNSAGRFDFGPFTIGRYDLEIMHGRGGFAVLKGVTVRAGQPTEVEAHLRDSGYVCGRVTLPEGAEPWAVWPVAWTPGQENKGLPTRGRMFSDGRFEIRGIPTERCTVMLELFLPDGGYYVARARDVDVGRTDVDLILKKAEQPKGQFSVPR